MKKMARFTMSSHIGKQNCQKVEKMAPYPEMVKFRRWCASTGEESGEKRRGSKGEREGEKVVEDRSLGSAAVKLITPRNCLN